jgi:hypothetical protein
MAEETLEMKTWMVRGVQFRTEEEIDSVVVEAATEFDALAKADPEIPRGWMDGLHAWEITEVEAAHYISSGATDLREPHWGKSMCTDAVRFCDCPKCGAQAGKSCHTPKGRKTDSPHGERTTVVKALADKFNADPWRIQAMNIDDVLADLMR